MSRLIYAWRMRRLSRKLRTPNLWGEDLTAWEAAEVFRWCGHDANAWNAPPRLLGKLT